MNPHAMLLNQYWKAEQERRRELISRTSPDSGGTTRRHRFVARFVAWFTHRPRRAAVA